MSTDNDNEKITRKLRAILSADVKGYSLLMADDEVHTIQTLKAYRSLMSDLIIQHSGRVVDNPGDNLLAEFSSAVDAVESAVKIQNRLNKENAKFVEDKRLLFRIGVNIGDVVHDGDRIYGSGVNVAARIESIADAGGICISRNTYDQVKDKLDLGFDYLGEHEVKNIKEPVRVYKTLSGLKDTGKPIDKNNKISKLKWVFGTIAVLLVITATLMGGVYWKYFYLPTPSDIDPENELSFDLPKGPSIAVLPLDNMTGNSEQEFFCDGITENIISALSLIPNLFVIARNSTFTYKGKSITAQQVGQELGAQYLIEGSIQESINRIRITIQLIETKTGHHKWSEIYDRELDDIFKLQDEITLSILKAINVNITLGDRFRGYHEAFTNIQVYLKFLKAYDLSTNFSRESNLMAQKELHEIEKLDPNISAVYSLLGNTYIMDIWNGSCDRPLICFAKATEAIRKALSLNESDQIAFLASANLSFMRKEYENAILHIKKALSINPNGADCYALYSYILTSSGRSNEAIAFLEKAILLNPIPPSWYYLIFGNIYADLGQYNKAIMVYKQSEAIKPNYLTYLGLANIYSLIGNEIKASEAVSDLLRLRPDFTINKFVKIIPYYDQDRLDSYAKTLRKAGLPE